VRQAGFRWPWLSEDSRYEEAETSNRRTIPAWMTILGFGVRGRAGTTVSCAYVSAEADEEMPKIEKAGGVSRFLDALFYRNSVVEN
jgi:hypothetical protein